MGINNFIGCEETKENVWIGQDRNTDMFGKILQFGLYTGEEKTMLKLENFLNKTRGKKLIFNYDEFFYEGYWSEEFEIEDLNEEWTEFTDETDYGKLEEEEYSS